MLRARNKGYSLVPHSPGLSLRGRLNFPKAAVSRVTSCSRCGWQRLCLTCRESYDPSPTPGMIPADQLFQTSALRKTGFFFKIKSYLKTKPLYAGRFHPPQPAPLAPALELESSEMRTQRELTGASLSQEAAQAFRQSPSWKVELEIVVVLFSVPSPYICTAPRNRDLKTQVSASSEFCTRLSCFLQTWPTKILWLGQ